MPMKPLVTVVIPNFNYAKYLPDCLTAILNQSYAHLEIIFVDDGSTDDSIVIAQTYSGKVHIIPNEHSGVNSARNLGIRNANGKYIAFCDSDDVWLSTKIELQVNFLEKNPECGLVYSGIQIVTEDLAFIESVDAKDAGDCSKEFIKRPGEAIVLLGASTALIRGNLVKEIGGFDESLNGPGEDLDFFRRISEKTTINFIDDHLVMYRQHQISASRVSSEKYYDGNRKVLLKLFRENRHSTTCVTRRVSWIKLHWTFFKNELKKLKFLTAVKQFLPALRKIDY
jgi:glycosyltransferase involved in cell wall biosynthesis